jgi:hypothetical protein
MVVEPEAEIQSAHGCMSFFSAALDRLLADHQMLQADLSRLTGIKTGPLSRYFSGSAPAPDALRKIVAALPRGREELVTAWVRDALPEDLRKGISYTAASSGAPGARPDGWERLDAGERRLFEELVRRCHENPKVRPLLEQVLEVLQPD